MADKISKVEETTSYDNYVGKKETIKSHGLPIEEETLNMNVKENHWVGMPEFEQENNPTYKTIYIHFRNKEDFDKFSEMYYNQIDNEQRIADKTKSLWYPHLDRDANSLKRWIEE